MKLSVILTSYNHGRFIKQTIESVLAQDFKSFEFVIIDDYSTDNSIDIISSFNDDSRIKFIQNPHNLGMVASVNRGIAQAKGKYIAHINSDDIWSDKSKLSKQIKYLDKHPQCAAAFTTAKLIDENGKSSSQKNIFRKTQNKTRQEWLNQFFHHGNSLCYPSVMVRKAAYEELGMFDQRYTILLDLDMWIKLCLKYEIHILDIAAMSFRVGANSLSNQSGVHNILEYETPQILHDMFKNISLEDFNNTFPEFNRNNLTKEQISAYAAIICLHMKGSKQAFAVNYLQNNLKLLDQYDLGLSANDFLKKRNTILKSLNMYKKSGRLKKIIHFKRSRLNKKLQKQNSKWLKNFLSSS